MRKSPLPPLDLLIPFEAAARLGGFTRAAEELNITQSAISQRVRSLEDHLGVALFERRNRGIALTARGRELLNGATVALQHLRAAADSVRSTDATPRVRVAADSSIAQMDLVPRLIRFARRHEGIAFDLTVSDDRAARLDAEIAILHGDGDWPGFDATELFGDAVFPVCAPEYLRGNPVSEPEDLLDRALIDLDYQHWNWMNWSIWMAGTGLDPTSARRVLRCNNYPAVIEAARGGMGLALGWGRFTDGDLAAGRLVRPLDTEVTTRFGYYLALNHTASEAARALAAWLIADYREG